MAAVPQERDSRLAERLVPARGLLRDDLKAAFKAPSLPYQSNVVTSFIAYRPEWAGFNGSWQKGMLEGSTPMGPSKHLNRPHARQDACHGSRLSSAWRLSLRMSLVVAALLGLTAAASAQGAVRSVHGDWQIRCDTPPGAQTEQCALIQSVVAEDRSNAGLTVIVLKTADQKSKLMRVVAPLGVLLPSGLGLKLDNVDVGRAGFVRCLPNGCVAEVVMDDKLLGQLRNAKTATFIIFETPEEGIGFPLSLNGLGEGYDKLP
jgi:invasion protein IalB